MSTIAPAERKKVAIVLHSGAYDRIYQASAIALTAVAMGKEVMLFLLFWSLKKFAEGRLDERDESGEYGEWERETFQRMAQLKAPQVTEMLQQGRELGLLKIYACSASLQFLNVQHEALKSQVDDVVGLPMIVKWMGQAETTLFI